MNTQRAIAIKLRARIRSVLASGKIRRVILLGAVPIAIIIPGTVAWSHCDPGVVARAPLSTAIDPYPGGLGFSHASGASGGERVGFGGPGIEYNWHAVLWRGSTASLVDLRAFLPPGFIGSTGPKAVLINGGGPVELLLTDPQGRRTGFDPVHNTLFHDIPTAAYWTEIIPCSDDVKVLEMANRRAGQYALDVIGAGSGHFAVDITVSGPSGDWLTHSFVGMAARGISSRFVFQGEVNVFAVFEASVNINTGPKAFEVNGTFTLGPGGTISPMTQPVSIKCEYFISTIPAGAFKQTQQGTFVFEGTIDGIALDANLTPTGGNNYAFNIKGAGPLNLPSANPVRVWLAIGNNGGSVSVNADFEP